MRSSRRPRSERDQSHILDPTHFHPSIFLSQSCKNCCGSLQTSPPLKCSIEDSPGKSQTLQFGKGFPAPLSDCFVLLLLSPFWLWRLMMALHFLPFLPPTHLPTHPSTKPPITQNRNGAKESQPSLKETSLHCPILDFLDAIASPSTYPCQSVGEWVSESVSDS